MLRRLIAGLLARPPAARSRPASGVVTPAATDPAGGASESVPELEALAERAARSGCHAEAISHLERAAALTPQDLQLQLRLAQARVESRQFSVAAAGLASAIAEERRRSAPDARALGRAELMLGLSCLRSMALDDAFAAFLRAYEADPSNDVPLQLATYSRVMQFEWPATRTALPASTAAAHPAGDAPVRVVYFYVSTPNAPHPSARQIDYLELLRASAASARRHVPGARIVLLTDTATVVPQGIGIDEVRRFDLDPEQLMVARCVATAGYLAHPGSPADTVLVDPSTYFTGDWREVYGGDYDVGLVWRSDTLRSNQDIMPVYAGVTFVQAGRGPAAARYFERLLACLDALETDAAVREAYPKGLRRWWGDQLAPAALIGWRSFYEHLLTGATDRVRVDDLELRFFSATRYYGAPGDESEAGACILKFKGRLKREMLAFAAAREG